VSVLNEERKIIFIHIPKTGGTSMCKRKFLQPVLEWHTSLQGLRTQHGDLDFNEYFKFAFVRNPYTRFISQMEGEPSMEKWKRYIEEKHSLARTQLSFIQLDGKIGVDFIGRYENLKEDWKEVCERIGVDSRLSFVNKTEKRFEGRLDREFVALINSFYAVDFKEFGYEALEDFVSR